MPDTTHAVAPPPKRISPKFWYKVLAFELLVLACVAGPSWARHTQLCAAELGIHWSVLVLGWIVGLLVLYQLMLFVHESGHVVGAWLARFRVLTFMVGWLQIRRNATGWNVRLTKPTAKLGGMVLAMPRHARNLRSRYGLLIAGGPTANLLTGGLALFERHQLVAGAAAAVGGAGHYWLLFGLLTFGWISVLIGCLNLLPVRLPSGHLIDGRQLLHLMQGGPAMHQHLSMLQVQALDYAGIRPREWRAELIEQLLARQSQTVLDCYAHIYAYSHYHDCNDLERLRFHLNRALDRLPLAPVALQQYLLTEAAYVAALHTHDVEQARYWLNRAQEVKPLTKDEGLFARAAVAYAEGHLSEAENWLQSALKKLQDGVATGSTAQAAERMHALRATLQQARQCVPSKTGPDEAKAALVA